ncbi:MAG: hypothetical protein MI754_08235, partial [Chromatiales bacterium]|nr:hypothetical protein [Chromatiales bacterium]
LEQTCISCHFDDDVHNEQQGAVCENCHSDSGWGDDVFFQHDITDFPLIGQHAAVACEGCHLSGEFKNTEKKCDSCHEDDDAHEQTLGTACQTCHNPNGWISWIFNHNNQTEFDLTGKHDGLECGACHREPLNNHKKMSTRCITCHRKDDEHKGRFGKDCVRCHTTESFSDVKYNR